MLVSLVVLNEIVASASLLRIQSLLDPVELQIILRYVVELLLLGCDLVGCSERLFTVYLEVARDIIIRPQGYLTLANLNLIESGLLILLKVKPLQLTLESIRDDHTILCKITTVVLLAHSKASYSGL